MNNNYSDFAQRFLKPSGTKQLMEDLSEVANGDLPIINLGGGNPGYISTVHDVFRQGIDDALKDRTIDDTLRRYDGPQGHLPFRKALADQLTSRFGWPISAGNIALTAGSQTSFFMLFNSFAGLHENGQQKKVMLPLAPEYIGYSDLGIEDDMLVSKPGVIEIKSENTFKYRLDFNQTDLTSDVGLVCVSRPTNPTGNVLTDDEVSHLIAITKQAGVPFIIDGAYGLPFPNIVFSEASPMWDEHVILCLSLSKLGLPGLRTGIVIANEETIEVITAMNAIFSLANNSLGAQIVEPLVRSGEIFELSNNVINRFYLEKSAHAKAWIEKYFADMKYFLHESEGAIFLWLWFPDLSITDIELYQRLKRRGVLVLPGSYFFSNHDPKIEHEQQCIRLAYAQDSKQVEQGIAIIAEEVQKALLGLN